ncbi:MAG: hypothetical protein H7X89_06700, partial [Rhizobiales bacterium]|nr:hypothetical protein [Hyphomicrobiales bacterium]
YSKQVGLSLRAQAQAFSVMNFVVRGYPKTHIAPLLTGMCIAREAGFSRWPLIDDDPQFFVELARFLGFGSNETRKNGRSNNRAYYDQILQIFLMGTLEEQRDPKTPLGGLIQTIDWDFRIDHSQANEVVRIYWKQIEFAESILH